MRKLHESSSHTGWHCKNPVCFLGLRDCQTWAPPGFIASLLGWVVGKDIPGGALLKNEPGAPKAWPVLSHMRGQRSHSQDPVEGLALHICAKASPDASDDSH